MLKLLIAFRHSNHLMKRALPLVLIVIAVAVVFAVFAVDRQSVPQLGASPVVVELFTSQGCSSCPPADELLGRIARDEALRGKVIPLSFHVDYWNSLGWRDPFSSREWSQRQGEYVRAMKLDSAYTPQIVVNGTRQMVGSSSGAVYRAIEEESRRKPQGSVSVRIDGGDVVVRAQTRHADAELLVVAFEQGATTKVERGENAGRTISNDAIVRKLVRVGALKGGGVIEERVALPLGPRMGAAAFLQDRATKRIVAAGAVTPPGA
jgi:hypothetical protein